jgi:hypothetical protein
MQLMSQASGGFPWWAWTISGVLVYVWVWRITFRWMTEYVRNLSWFDFWAAVFLCTFFFWLVALFWFHDVLERRTTPKALARVVAGESRRAKRERRDRELSERERRVREAEKELGFDA